MLGTGFKHLIVLGILAVICPSGFSQEKIILWPNGAPGAKGDRRKGSTKPHGLSSFR